MTLPIVRTSSLLRRTTCRFRLHPAALVAALLLFAVAPASVSASLAASPPQSQDSTVIVYLVRHAEKADDGTNDPPLAVAGQIRVRILRVLLADADLTHVHTTDWKRTRETAAPIAEAAGLEPVLYDPRALEDVAAEIGATPGRHLVVGHSDTTPRLTAALGGDPSGSIQELEYDRLYIVTIVPGRPPLTTLLRFGEPFVAGQDFSLRASREPARPTATTTAGRQGN